MYLDRLFKLMAEKQASDIFISCGAPINIKVNGVVSPVSTQPMDPETVRRIAYELMTKDQAREFENELEMNLSHLDRAVGNFRINIFRQRGTLALVIRYVRSSVPPFEQLRLPPVLLDMVMAKRGLVLVAGATGSGKSTTLASMIDHRNEQKTGHILTLEDPIEYRLEGISQTQVADRKGMTFATGLRHVLRQVADQLQALLERPHAQRLQRLVQRGPQGEAGRLQRQLVGGQPREVQELIEQLHQPVRRSSDRPEIVPYGGAQVRAARQHVQRPLAGQRPTAVQRGVHVPRQER